MNHFAEILKGGDLRSIGNANQVVSLVHDQPTFDELFSELYNSERIVAMRAADAIEKITAHNPHYLYPHKHDILALCKKVKEIELKWHWALLVPRLDLTKEETGYIWKTLTDWAADKKESRIVRVNALQALHDIVRSNEELTADFTLILKKMEQENIPSINARIRNLKNG